MAPRLIFNVLCVQEKNPVMHFFLSKVPVNEPPPGPPTGSLKGELPVYRAIFYTSLKLLVKYFP
jgi:hypothetical protein